MWHLRLTGGGDARFVAVGLEEQSNAVETMQRCMIDLSAACMVTTQPLIGCYSRCSELRGQTARFIGPFADDACDLVDNFRLAARGLRRVAGAAAEGLNGPAWARADGAAASVAPDPSLVLSDKFYSRSFWKWRSELSHKTVPQPRSEIAP
jgi:hypothetical protein